jgi:hypothetical protein
VAAAGEEGTTVTKEEEEDFDEVRRVELVMRRSTRFHFSGGTCLLVRSQCDLVLGRERPHRDDHEAWNQRDAPRFRGADTEIRAIPSLHERAGCTLR